MKENKNKELEDSIYRVLWDIFKDGWIHGNRPNPDYFDELEDLNQKLMETSGKIINHIKENLK